MLAPDSRELARYAVGYGVDFGSPELTALTTTLTQLAEISDDVTNAVQRHDRPSLEQANERAEGLVSEVNRLAAALTQEDRALVGGTAIAGLCQRLAVAARRNAYLIEQAWAVDAALMRLLVGVGTAGAEGTVSGYGSQPGPTYVDREA
jgi:hypothetical protein